jgi:Flp pilus assembly protein TadD
MLAVLLPSASAADDWIEVKSPNFTVVSNAGDGRARNIAWQFEQIRAAIQIGWPWARVQLDRPVIVVAAKDENSMKLLIPGFWEKSSRDTRPASVFGTGAAAHYITLRSDVRADDTIGVNPYVSSYWSYSALTLNEAFERPLPLWFRNGLAELLSNSIVRDNEIQFGRAIPWNVRSLQQDGRLRLSELVALDSKSPYYTNGATRPRFDAQSWGVIHYMLFGLADGGARINQLAEQLLKGTPSAEAIQSVFGSVDALEQAYLNYQKKPITQFARLKVETNAAAKNFPVRALTAGESAGVHAAVHASFSRPVEARAAIAAAGENRGAATYDVEALLFDREGKRDEARGAYTKAVELDSESFYTHYRLATLLWTASADAETRRRIETLLRRSVALNNFYSPSQAFLADTIVQGATPADALPVAIRAATLDPSSARARMTLARVLGRIGRRDEAIGHARASRALAQTDAERSAAEELIAFLTRQPQI